MADNRPPRSQDPLDLAPFGKRRLLINDDPGGTPPFRLLSSEDSCLLQLSTSKGSSCPRFVHGLNKISLGVFLPQARIAGAHDSAGAPLSPNAFPGVAEGGEELQSGDKVVRDGTAGIRLEPENLAEIPFAAPAALAYFCHGPQEG